MRAQKVGKRAKNAGMDFESTENAVKSLESEISELKTALNGHNDSSKPNNSTSVNNSSNTAPDNVTNNVKEEIGDVLFSAVNVSRHLGIDAEEALRESTNKFINRFSKVEETVKEKSPTKDMKDFSIDELDEIWKLVK
jgi:tetrapyrrole methylase family protein/MazG family protein